MYSISDKTSESNYWVFPPPPPPPQSLQINVGGDQVLAATTLPLSHAYDHIYTNKSYLIKNNNPAILEWPDKRRMEARQPM